jgi:hypothetical protein
MGASETAAWWQAIISGIAIIASGLIAVFVPWNERRVARRRADRARLDVDTRVSNNGGLELLISYKPEFHHQALSVGVTLIVPSDACLYRGQLEWPKARGERPTGVKGSLATSVRYNGVPLLMPPGGSRENIFQGFMFIEYPDERKGPSRATIQVDVLAHGNRLTAREKMEISPTDAEFYSNDPPRVLLDARPPLERRGSL